MNMNRNPTSLIASLTLIAAAAITTQGASRPALQPAAPNTLTTSVLSFFLGGMTGGMYSPLTPNAVYGNGSLRSTTGPIVGLPLSAGTIEGIVPVTATEPSATPGGPSAPSIIGACWDYPLPSWNIVCTLGSNCAGGPGCYHLAEDVTASVWTPVHAAADGVVKMAQYIGGYGGFVAIETDTGSEVVVHIYGHLFASSLEVAPGDIVSVGDVIGYIADKAHNGGWDPHLHHGIRKGPFQNVNDLCGNGSCGTGWAYEGYTPCWSDVSKWYAPSQFIPAHQSCSTIAAPTPTSPPNYTLSDNQYVNMVWTAVSGATDYNLQVDDNFDFSSPCADIVVPGGTSSYNFGLPWTKDIYYWRVRAKLSGAWGPFSTRWAVSWRPAVTGVLPNFDCRNGMTDVGFEDSAYRNWGFSKAGLTNDATPGGSAPYEGYYAARILATDSNSDLTKYIYQSSIIASPAGTYTFSAWVRSVTGKISFPNLRVAIEAYDAAGAYISNSRSTSDYDADTGWARVSKTYTAPAATATLKVILYNKGNVIDNHIIVDASQFEAGGAATDNVNSLDRSYWSFYADTYNAGLSDGSVKIATITARDWGQQIWSQFMQTQATVDNFIFEVDMRRRAAAGFSPEIAEVEFDMADDTSSYRSFNIVPPAGDTNWHRVKVVNYVTGTGTITRLFRDGVLVSTAPGVIGSPASSGRIALGHASGFDYEYDRFRVYPDTTPPSFVGLYSAQTDCAAGAIVLSWPAASDADTDIATYRVYRSTVAGQLGNLLASTASLTYTDAAITPGAIYYYTVRPVDGAGNESQNLIQRSATAMFQGLGAGSLALSRQGADVLLSWPVVGGSNYYKVYRSENAANLKTDPTSVIYTTTSTSYINTGAAITPATYYYGVEGFNTTCPGGSCVLSSVPSTSWRGEYYANTALSGSPAMVRNDGTGFITFDWGTGSPDPSCVPADNFSARWARVATFSSAVYRFAATTDDGVRLFVDGSLVLDDWTNHAATTHYVDVTMVAGDHLIVMEYFDGVSLAVAKLSWANVGAGCVQSVPSTDWRGEYFANMTLSGSPLMVRDDGAGFLGFNWGGGSPSIDCGIPADAFSARFTRTVNFPTAGNYRFRAVGDDGVRLYVDGVLRINGWWDHAPTVFIEDVSLSAGNHTLVVEYYENSGGAVAQLSWEAYDCGEGSYVDVKKGADFDGNGAKEFVRFFAGSGKWKVALSTFSTFLPLDMWLCGHGVGSTAQMVGDINGDGRADCLVFFESTGEAWVALSVGNAFDYPYKATTSAVGQGMTNKWLADVNGDGREDFVGFRSDGAWFVSLSNGSTFGPWFQATSGHGSGSQKRLMGDINGDGMSDAIAYFDITGSMEGHWYVAYGQANGTFSGYHAAALGHGHGSTDQFLGDVNGDGKADAICFWDTFGSEHGVWIVWNSDGWGFVADNTKRAVNVGYGSQNRIVADFTSGGTADIATWTPTAGWCVSTSNGYWFSGCNPW